MHVRVGVLGPVEIQQEEGRIDVARPKVRHLVALLALSDGEWIGRDQLVAELWPTEQPQSPRSALHVVVSRARRLFGDAAEVVESSGEHYRLRLDRCSLDLREWSDLVERGRSARHADPEAAADAFASARRLWRGDVVASGIDSPMVATAGSQLGRARIDADLDEASLLIELDRPSEAVVILRDAVARDPLREDVVAETMRALAHASRTAEALALAAEFRTLVREELGASPGEVFADQERMLLGGATNIRHRAGAEPLPADGWHRAEVEEVVEAVAASLDRSTPAVVVVEAPPGFGLTRCLATAARRIEQRTGAAVAVLDATAVLAVSADDAVAPVLVVDDAHELPLAELARLPQLAGPGGAVVLGSHTPLTRAWPILRPTVVTLRVLDVRDVARVLGPLRPDLDPASVRREAERLCERYQRHPGWIANALAASAGADALPIPDAARVAAHDLIARLADGERRVVEIAAVIGDPINSHLLVVLAEESLVEVVAALDHARDLGLAVDGDQPIGWRFAHPLTTDVLVAGVPRDRQRYLHARAAEWLRAEDGGPRRAARHLVAALPLVEESVAEEAAREAAALAAADGDHEDARDLFAAAAGLARTPGSRDRARLGQATAAELLGERATANQIYDELIAGGGASDPDLLAEVALGGAGHASRIGGQEARRRRLGIAYRRLALDHPRADEVAAEYGLELLIAGLPIDREMWARLQGIAGDEGSPGQLPAMRLVLVVDELHRGASIDDAATLAARAIAADVDTDGHHAAASLAVCCQLALVAGDWGLAERWIDELEYLGAASREPRARWQSAAYRVALVEGRGRSEEADLLASSARELGESLGLADAATTYGLHHLARAYRAGSLASFAPVLESTAERYRFPVWRAMRGLAEHDAGNERAASLQLDLALDALDGGPDTFRTPAVALVCELGGRVGGRERCLPHVERLRARSGSMVFLGYGGPFLGPADHFLARWYEGMGEAAEATRWRQAAQQAARRVGASWGPEALAQSG